MLEKIILEIKQKAQENHIPIVRDQTIEKVVDIINKNNFKSILEIGTAVGYSGIMMLNSSAQSLTTIEKNLARFNEAKANFKLCNLEERVRLFLGDALEELEKLVLKEEKFDFIFLDGPKGQYIRYLPYLKSLLNKGGIIFADNILMGGLIDDEKRVNHKNRAMVKNMKAFLNAIQTDSQLETTLFRIEDGYSISKLI